MKEHEMRNRLKGGALMSTFGHSAHDIEYRFAFLYYTFAKISMKTSLAQINTINNSCIFLIH